MEASPIQVSRFGCLKPKTHPRASGQQATNARIFGMRPCLVGPIFEEALVGMFLFPETACAALMRHYIDRSWHAGWSSPVARQAHNLKAAGSNPAPATKFRAPDQCLELFCWRFWFLRIHGVTTLVSLVIPL